MTSSQGVSPISAIRQRRDHFADLACAAMTEPGVETANVARAVSFSVSDDSCYITGVSLPADVNRPIGPYRRWHNATATPRPAFWRELSTFSCDVLACSCPSSLA